MKHRLARTIAVVVVLSACTAPIAAQPLRRIPVKPANATVDAEFVGLTSVREIADGRVLVTDGRDRQLYVADFQLKIASRLGRTGKGPGEYLIVGFVQSIGGDSSILSDMANRRWLLLDGARIVGVVPPDHPAVRATQSTLADVDHLGRILKMRGPPARHGTTIYTRADSSALVFVDRKTGHSDTVAMLRQSPHRTEVVLAADGHASSIMSFATEPNMQAESATLFADGWLAIVRLEPLRIDWRSPSGAWTLGTPLPLTAERVDAAERKAVAARFAEARADARKIGFPEPAATAFPTTLPVTSGMGMSMSDGRLLLRRRSSASKPNPRYLVINRLGSIDGEITLRPKEKIIGFGPRSIYIVVTEDDDIQFLRRHPWP